MYGRVVASTTELRGFIREAVGDVYRYALALTVSTTRAEQLTTAAAVRLARHVDAVGAAPVSATRLTLVVRREVLDTLPPRRRRRRTLPPTAAPGDFARSTSSLDALASLSIEQRLALVLRHHDGLLLPDIAAALGVTYPEAEQILHSARDRLAGVVDRYDDGGGADPFGRLVRSVPGPPDALADRVWVTVDEALVPDYAEDGSVWTNGKAGRVPDLSDGDDPLGWEGFNAVPVDERHVPPAREARHVGTTLLIGAGALGVLLAVAALTAPRDDQADTTAGGIGATTPSDAPLTNPTTVATSVAGTAPARLGRGATPPAEPDLVIDAELVSPHSPTEVQALNDPTVTRPDPTRLAEVSVRVRNRDDVSRAGGAPAQRRRHQRRVAPQRRGPGARFTGRCSGAAPGVGDRPGQRDRVTPGGRRPRCPGAGRPAGGRWGDVATPARWCRAPGGPPRRLRVVHRAR